MRRTRVGVLAFGLVMAAALSACTINVQKEKGGEDKQVDINTPLGGIHVSKDADAQDVGMAIYPGARLKPKDSSGNDKGANVNISGFGYGLKVVALEYQSDDAPAKLVSYYRDQLKKYGKVLECRTSGLDVNADIKKANEGSKELTCEGSSGNNVELKVGTRENQHIVEVEPEGKGSTFSLVYVRTHGKDSDI
jgi:hypothetical protein